MNILIWKNNEQLGPYSESEIAEKLREGTLTKDDMAYVDGQADWIPLSNLLPPPPPPQQRVSANNPSSEKNSKSETNIFSNYSGKSGLILGILIGIIVATVGYLSWRPSSDPVDNRVWFRVYAPAEFPKGAWFGDLCASGNKTEIIVDFGESLKLAKDDRLEGTFVMTDSTGKWNNGPFRIYKLKGKFRFIDPLSVK
ncbi:MAG: GYF domain-containing protein [Verrucomicrobiota bacterium]